jgi:hypothetical protein
LGNKFRRKLIYVTLGLFRLELSMSYTSCINLDRDAWIEVSWSIWCRHELDPPSRFSDETVDLEIRDLSNFFCYVPCIQVHTSHHQAIPPHNSLNTPALTCSECPRSRRTRYPRSRLYPGRSSSTIGTRTPTTSSHSSSPSIRTTRSGGKWS